MRCIGLVEVAVVSSEPSLRGEAVGARGQCRRIFRIMACESGGDCSGPVV